MYQYTLPAPARQPNGGTDLFSHTLVAIEATGEELCRGGGVNMNIGSNL